MRRPHLVFDRKNLALKSPNPIISLRLADSHDAAFILALVNDPQWKKHIGDRNVHSIEDAINFIHSGPKQSYRKHGFGLYVIELHENEKTDPCVIGLCGLLQRDFLTHPDIGYAMLPSYRGKGYTSKACQLVLGQDVPKHKLQKVYAMISPANLASIRLIERLGFKYIETMTHDDLESLLYEKVF